MAIKYTINIKYTGTLLHHRIDITLKNKLSIYIIYFWIDNGNTACKNMRKFISIHSFYIFRRCTNPWNFYCRVMLPLQLFRGKTKMSSKTTKGSKEAYSRINPKTKSINIIWKSKHSIMYDDLTMNAIRSLAYVLCFFSF